MKTIQSTIAALLSAAILFASCKKDSSSTNGHFTSVADFLNQNALAIQTFSVDAATGGSFTTPQGTVVTIPANDFKLPSGSLATGNISVAFKDIYKKSDMLFCDMPTTFNGSPLKSGGEFFISAKAGDSLVQIVNKITVQQPANGIAIDSMMKPFVGVVNDSNSLQAVNWANNQNQQTLIDTLTFSPSGYVFSLYTFQEPVATGTWCNSDNPYYFSAYPLTSLTLIDTANVNSMYISTSVFLVFKNINCMVHVYEGSGNSFPYAYAPQGLACTVVAVAVDNSGNLNASFTPVTIGNNQTENFGLTPITETDFKAKLTALN